MIKEFCMPGILTQLLLNKHDNICRMYGISVKELRCTFLECLKKSHERFWKRQSEFCMPGEIILSHRRSRNCFHYSFCVLQFINNTILIENKIFYIKTNNLKSNNPNQILSEAMWVI